MKEEKLFNAFVELFPEWAKQVLFYKKIGSNCLAITFANGPDQTIGKSRVFLYNDPNNWHFGSKLWRKKPKRIEKI